MAALNLAPKDLKTCRARVWQSHWAPMPWDYCRRTAFTETMRLTSAQKSRTCCTGGRRFVDADAYQHVKSPKDRARIGSEPLPWSYRGRVGNSERQIHSGSLATGDPKDRVRTSDKLPTIVKPYKSPRDLPTCRARVWQEEWDPMPWDEARRTVQLETRGHGCGRYEESRRNRWDTRQKRYRQYQVHFYGAPRDKEMKNSHLRACLKEQLAQVEPPHKQFVKQVGESQAVAEQTRREEEREQQRQAKHRAFLSEFRDSNKQTMDTKAQQQKELRKTEAQKETSTLALNPINWSYSLW